MYKHIVLNQPHASVEGLYDNQLSYWQINTDFINNVVYNWGGNSSYGGEGTTNGAGGRHIDMVNNYYKSGNGGKTTTITKVSASAVPNVPGGLSKLLDVLDDNDVNVEYGYCFSTSGDRAVDILQIRVPAEASKAVNFPVRCMASVRVKPLRMTAPISSRWATRRV